VTRIIIWVAHWTNRSAAGQLRISVEEYEGLRAAGLKWCYACRTWQGVSELERDLSIGRVIPAVPGFEARAVSCGGERIIARRHGPLPPKILEPVSGPRPDIRVDSRGMFLPKFTGRQIVCALGSRSVRACGPALAQGFFFDQSRRRREKKALNRLSMGRSLRRSIKGGPGWSVAALRATRRRDRRRLRGRMMYATTAQKSAKKITTKTVSTRVSSEAPDVP
jgi:hypothetical protein